MNAANALRFLAREAARCHALSTSGDSGARDAHTMLCLWLPTLLKVNNLEPMDQYEARAFELDVFTALREGIEQEREHEVPA